MRNLDLSSYTAYSFALGSLNFDDLLHEATTRYAGVIKESESNLALMAPEELRSELLFAFEETQKATANKAFNFYTRNKKLEDISNWVIHDNAWSRKFFIIEKGIRKAYTITIKFDEYGLFSYSGLIPEN